MNSRAMFLFAGTVLSATTSLAQVVPGHADAKDGVLPRSLTPAEAEYVRRNPITPPFGGRNIPTPPAGPVHCTAEYEPVSAIIVGWQGTSTGINTILGKMGARITNEGNADFYVVVSGSTGQNTATNALNAQGANMSRVKFFTRSLNSVWMRDYGPRYIYQGDCRAIVDHTYNRPRPNDDAFSQWFGPVRTQLVYDIPLVHGGGNFHLSAAEDGFATRLINNENPGLTEPQILAHWSNYQNLDVHLFPPFPTSVDSTQHIDMWMQVFGDNKVMVSDWPSNAGSAQDIICDDAAAYMASQGYQVTRLPARSLSGTHYTYTNVVICNDIVLIPTYTNSTIVNAGHNTEAFNAWKSVWESAAQPQRRVYQVDCQSIVTLAGVMHCIVMHIPQPVGGANPTAYVAAPDGGESFAPGAQTTIRWAQDDDKAVTGVDLMLSIDGGDTFPITIASNSAPDGSLVWTVPNVYTHHARVKALARDAQANTGFDISDADFTISGSCPPDFDGDAFVTGLDFDLYVQAFESGSLQADFDGDGFLTGVDFDTYTQAYEAGC